MGRQRKGRQDERREKAGGEKAHPRIYQDSGAYAAVFFLSQEITVAAAPAGE